MSGKSTLVNIVQWIFASIAALALLALIIAASIFTTPNAIDIICGG